MALSSGFSRSWCRPRRGPPPHQLGRDPAMVGASASISGFMAAATRLGFQPGGPLDSWRHHDPESYLIPAAPLPVVLRNPRVFAFLGVWFGLNLLFGVGRPRSRAAMRPSPGRPTSAAFWRIALVPFVRPGTTRAKLASGVFASAGIGNRTDTCIASCCNCERHCPRTNSLCCTACCALQDLGG